LKTENRIIFLNSSLRPHGARGRGGEGRGGKEGGRVGGREGGKEGVRPHGCLSASTQTVITVHV
jgi:hypothetical protein